MRRTRDPWTNGMQSLVPRLLGFFHFAFSYEVRFADEGTRKLCRRGSRTVPLRFYQSPSHMGSHCTIPEPRESSKCLTRQEEDHGTTHLDRANDRTLLLLVLGQVCRVFTPRTCVHYIGVLLPGRSTTTLVHHHHHAPIIAFAVFHAGPNQRQFIIPFVFSYFCRQHSKAPVCLVRGLDCPTTSLPGRAQHPQHHPDTPPNVTTNDIAQDVQQFFPIRPCVRRGCSREYYRLVRPHAARSPPQRCPYLLEHHMRNLYHPRFPTQTRASIQPLEVRPGGVV